MQTIYYYPGCSLTNKAKSFNQTAKDCLKLLGLELVELKDWYCCQANYSLVTDNLMNHLASVRTLVQASRLTKKLAVLCSTCYYVLKRVNHLMQTDEAKRKVVLEFLELEEEYTSVEVVHLLEVLRDMVGFDAIKSKVCVELTDLKVAAYYGCQLLRPYKELKIDDPESPQIFEDFLRSIGCEPADYPFKIECCGAYLTANFEKAVEDCVARILDSSKRDGAEAIVTSCPLCHFNLDWFQVRLRQVQEDFLTMPVFYLTELLSLALGNKFKKELLDEHYIDILPLLEKKNLSGQILR